MKVRTRAQQAWAKSTLNSSNQIIENPRNLKDYFHNFTVSLKNAWKSTCKLSKFSSKVCGYVAFP